VPLAIEVLGTGPVVRPKPGEDCDYRLCTSIAELRDYLRPALQDREPFGADWESNSLNTLIAMPAGLSVSTGPKQGLYVPVGHLVEPELNLPVSEVIAVLQDADAAGAESLWYNVSYDLELQGRALGWEPVHWRDVQFAVFLIDSNVIELNLKSTSMRLLGRRMQELQQLDDEWIRLSKKQRKLTPFKQPNQLSPYIVAPYGCADADHTRQIWFHPATRAAVAEQPLILKLEEFLSPVMREGNRHGAYLDREQLVALREEATVMLKAIEPQIWAHLGEEFPLSRKQYLAAKLLTLVPSIVERTDGGDPTVSVKVLEKYKRAHPVVSLLIQHAKLTAQRANYIEKLIKAHDHFVSCPWAQGRVRFAFNAMGVPTGRMKCGGAGKGVEAFAKGTADVNAQSIPDHEKEPYLPNTRSAFCAPEDFVVVALDYSQIELRIPANSAREPKWLEIFQTGGDIHTGNAQIIANILEPGVTVTNDDKKRRGGAKATSFALLYGGDEHTIARNASVPLTEAKQVLDAFYAGLPTLKAWLEGLKSHARTCHTATTLMGRKRRLKHFFPPEPPRGCEKRVWKTWRQLVSRGEREAVNHPVQGGAADIFKTACVLIRRAIAAQGWDATIVSPQVLWIHDEVVLYVHHAWVTRVVPVIVAAMEFPIKNWAVPLKAEPEVGCRRLYYEKRQAKAQKDMDAAGVARWSARLAALTGPDTGRNSTWGELVAYADWVREYPRLDCAPTTADRHGTAQHPCPSAA
jgi:DNA polymerase-1